ncbi:hypothetical protein M9978_22210 [Sphingomonas sp. MG17]|uniref:Uncharacterized protein n=1 Tax=Sphingomonas tagetis TaxID=2949092 RepID=A0A9X2HW66_9SPHN|nr:hypothetical protein [Sphingomonas tagetis]MCP3733125.1 hypothetical protein [Sphingomonas tagetis]
MLTMLTRICERLQSNAYVNEAAISHGIVTPILGMLGWDSADPDQLVPEYRVDNGFVDFALIGLNRTPAIFIEVKGRGKAADGDRQLFSYAFHHGVPLCVLTDGAVWNFYVPSGIGSYEDRRVYRLQLDERTPAECEEIFQRYLSRDRVRSGESFADAQRDHQTAIGRRQAAAVLPRAWAELIAERDDRILETLAEKVEALSGYRPNAGEAEAFLDALKPARPAAEPRATAPATVLPSPSAPAQATDRTVHYTLFDQAFESPNASRALVDILRALAARDPSRIGDLADAVRTSRMAHVGRSLAEINPRKPEIARAVEFSPGWMVGLNIDNRTKMMIVRAASDVWRLNMPRDLDITMPNG